MVDLKICRVGGKIGQSSALGLAWPCLTYSPLTDPVALLVICGQADIMQNASVCILAKETAGFMPFSTESVTHC